MARKKKSKGLRVSLMLTVGLMIVSFAAGMLTQEPQTDAGLTYIEDIPVMTDFLPEGTRARPGQKREIKYLVIHETDNTGTGANAAAHNSFIHQNANAEEGIVSWHYTVDDHQIYQHLPDNEEAWHSGDREGNHSSIGIELCVNADGNFDQTMENAAKLTAFLLKEYDLTIDDVKQHYDFNGKDCPLIIRQEGRWDEFLGMVQQNL
mgnify:CR=1 FL=1